MAKKILESGNPDQDLDPMYSFSSNVINRLTNKITIPLPLPFGKQIQHLIYLADLPVQAGFVQHQYSLGNAYI